MCSSAGHIITHVSTSEDMSDLCFHGCVFLGPQVEQMHELSRLP